MSEHAPYTAQLSQDELTKFVAVTTEIERSLEPFGTTLALAVASTLMIMCLERLPPNVRLATCSQLAAEIYQELIESLANEGSA